MAGSGPQHTLSVVDLVSQKPLPLIDLGPLKGAARLKWWTTRSNFTAEGSKVTDARSGNEAGRMGRGHGQDRTHMLKVLPHASVIFSAT